MFATDAFGRNLDILKRSMDVSVLRRNVISNNIANAETPNFKRSVVNFETALRKALESQKARPPAQLVSDPRHIPFYQPQDYRDVQPRRVLDYLTTAKNNGNNVDLEEEMMLATQNQLLYQTLATVVSAEYSRVAIVLK